MFIAGQTSVPLSMQRMPSVLCSSSRALNPRSAAMRSAGAPTGWSSERVSPDQAKVIMTGAWSLVPISASTTQLRARAAMLGAARM